MSKTKAFIVITACLTIGIVALVSSNPENRLRGGSTTTCPGGEPAADYVTAAVAWLAKRDGLSPMIALPASVPTVSSIPTALPFSSPLATPVSAAASAFDSPLATPPPIPEDVGNYFVAGKRYFYAPELGKCYAEIDVIGQYTDRIDSLMVEVDSFVVSSLEEVDALRAGQSDPVQSKIDTQLKTRLQTLGATESVKVAIWLKAPPGEDVASRQDRVFKQLIATYPQAAEFMRLYGKPLGVDDSPESKFIWQKYERLMNESFHNSNVATVKTTLANRGVSTVDLSPMPALVATVSSQIVYDLAADAAVEKIYLADAEMLPAVRSPR
jgi:hypothetical protein